MCNARVGYNGFGGGKEWESPEVGEVGCGPESGAVAECGCAGPCSGSGVDVYPLSKYSPTTRPSAGEVCVRDLTSNVPDPNVGTTAV